MTVNAFARLAVLPSPLVIDTARGPVAAVDEMVIVAVSVVELVNVAELTVIPAPNDAASAGPLSKLLPVIVMLWFVAPCPRELGLVGLLVLSAGAGLIEKRLFVVTVVWSGLVTVTPSLPVLAVEAIEMFAVSCVALTNVVELTVMPAKPKETVAPGRKFVPVIVML